MQGKLHKDYKTIDYIFLLQRRPKAIQVDLGYDAPVWLTLEAIELKEDDFQITGEADFLDQKIKEPPKRTPPRMVKLAAPAWQNDKAYGYSVKVYRQGSRKFAKETRVFFPKSKVKSGSVEAWLYERKCDEIISEVNTGSKIPNSEFVVDGLLAKQKNASGSPTKPRKIVHELEIFLKN